MNIERFFMKAYNMTAEYQKASIVTAEKMPFYWFPHIWRHISQLGHIVVTRDLGGVGICLMFTCVRVILISNVISCTCVLLSVLMCTQTFACAHVCVGLPPECYVKYCVSIWVKSFSVACVRKCLLLVVLFIYLSISCV